MVSPVAGCRSTTPAQISRSLVPLGLRRRRQRHGREWRCTSAPAKESSLERVANHWANVLHPTADEHGPWSLFFLTFPNNLHLWCPMIFNFSYWFPIWNNDIQLMLVFLVFHRLILYRGNHSNSSLPVESHKLKNDFRIHVWHAGSYWINHPKVSVMTGRSSIHEWTDFSWKLLYMVSVWSMPAPFHDQWLWTKPWRLVGELEAFIA